MNVHHNILPIVLAALLAADRPCAVAAEPIDVAPALTQLVEQVDVPARVAGVLVSVNVVEGAVVEDGKLLASIDRREAELLYRRAQVEAKISEQIAANDVAVRAAMAAIDFAQDELQRIEDARNSVPGSIPLSAIEQKRYDVKKAVLDHEAAEREKKQNELQAELKKRELEVAKQRLRATLLYAPLPGMVVEILRRPGEWVEPGDKVLRVLRIDRLRVEGLVPAERLHNNLIGARADVSINVPGASDVKTQGKVTFVSPEVSAVNGQSRVWVEIDNPTEQLRPGLRATMKIYP